MEEAEHELPSSAFGALLRRCRLAAGLSQQALGERAKLSVNGISALESGARRTPHRKTLALLARALSLDDEARRAFEAAAARPPGLRPGDRRASALPNTSIVEALARPEHNLPFPVSRIIGRETELAEIVAILREHRLVTLTGAGGIGKTTIGLEVGGALAAGGDAAVWLVELAPLRDGTLIAATIARVLGLQEKPGRSPAEAVVSYLRNKPALLILDNCEHVVAGAASVANLLIRGCRQLRILATSREPLKLGGERVYRLGSLTVPAGADLESLDPAQAITYGAIELFVDRTQAVDHRFILHAGNASIIADICRRLDGIPLPIELAAARVTILSPQQLRERLDERFRVLTGDRRDVLPRHQTLRALIDWSYDLLDERERALMRRLGVFVHGFTLAGAVAVGGEGLNETGVLDVLESLVDKSLVLVERDAHAVRYRMLESIRAYARDKLASGGDLSSSLSRHVRHLRDLFASAALRAERSGMSREIDTPLVCEIEEVRAALEFSAGAAEHEMGAELLAAIAARWTSVGLAGEGFARLDRFLSLMPAGETRLTCRLWLAFSQVARIVDHIRALEAATTAVRLARAANDAQTLAHALAAQAYSLARARAFEDAAIALSEAEAHAPATVGLRLNIARAKVFLYCFSGELDAGAQACRSLVETHAALGNVSEAHNAAITLAEIEHRRGRTREAVATLEEGVLPALRVGRDHQSLQHALGNMCGYLVAFDRLAEALAIAREVFALSTEHDPAGNLVLYTIEHAALAITLAGDFRRGAQLAGYTEAALTQLGWRREYTECVTRARLEALLLDGLEPAERCSHLTRGAALSKIDALALANVDALALANLAPSSLARLDHDTLGGAQQNGA